MNKYFFLMIALIIKLLVTYKMRKFRKSQFLFQAEGIMLETSNFVVILIFCHRTRIWSAQKKLGEWPTLPPRGVRTQFFSLY